MHRRHKGHEWQRHVPCAGIIRSGRQEKVQGVGMLWGECISTWRAEPWQGGGLQKESANSCLSKAKKDIWVGARAGQIKFLATWGSRPAQAQVRAHVAVCTSFKMHPNKQTHTPCSRPHSYAQLPVPQLQHLSLSLTRVHSIPHSQRHCKRLYEVPSLMPTRRLAACRPKWLQRGAQSGCSMVPCSVAPCSVAPRVVAAWRLEWLLRGA